MLLIPCPFCGPRSEAEFAYGGPAVARRPEDPAAVGDEDWAAWLMVPPNPMGPVAEHWWHVRGCGGWMTIRRDTVTHEILGAADDG